MSRERSSSSSSDAFITARSGLSNTPIVIQQPEQQSVVRRAPLPYLSDSSEESISIPRVDPHTQYIQYDRNRRMAAQQPVSAYAAYDPFAPSGSHQQYGVPAESGQGYEYPYPSTSSLGQSQTGYTAQHPSEELLPRAQDDARNRAVYGTHEGRPIQGMGHWEHYFDEWQDIGQQYQVDIPISEPLTQEELQFTLKHGFTFEKQLGKGSFGTVWLVLATRLFKEPVPQSGPVKYVPKRLACKVLSLKNFKTPRVSLELAVKKLVQEADLHQQLSHRNIVKCEHIFHIHDQTTGFPYVRLLMFMELCDGDVKDILIQQKKFNEKLAQNMMNDVCDGLQYLHDQNIVHFDIKIHNIMYVREGGDHICYKLADFGVSKKYVSEGVAKIYGAMGTRLYMAPELLRVPTGLSLSKPADVYSLGCLLAEVLTGRGNFKQLLKDFKENGLTPQVCSKWQLGMLCAQLIYRMTDDIPTNRPTVAQT